MNIINTDTNTAVAGYKVPRGTFEFPLEGSIGVITSQGVSTNLTVGSGDTLIIWPGGAAVEQGVDTFAMFTLGIGLVVSVFGLMALARRFANILSAGKVREV